jgi:hypothetical protein
MASAAPLEGIDPWGSRASTRRSSALGSRNWGLGPDNVFGRNSAQSTREDGNDEEALKWAALEKLPTYDRLHTALMQKALGSKIVHEEVDVRTFGFEERQQIIDRLLQATEEDNERFLLKLRNRIDRYLSTCKNSLVVLIVVVVVLVVLVLVLFFTFCRSLLFLRSNQFSKVSKLLLRMMFSCGGVSERLRVFCGASL